MPLDLSDYPRFSLAERDRRWGRVRELMRQASCDCLVAPGFRDAEDQATSRYLSQIGGIGIYGWVVFPQNGEVTAIVESERNRDFAVKAQDWISDVRQQDVWFAMNDVLTRLAGSLPARLSVTFDGASNQSLGMPIPDRIRAGALCSQEICARFQGYRAQCNHTIQVGEGDPKDYATAMRATIDVFNEMLAWLNPGRTIDELC